MDDHRALAIGHLIETNLENRVTKSHLDISAYGEQGATHHGLVTMSSQLLADIGR